MLVMAASSINSMITFSMRLGVKGFDLTLKFTQIQEQVTRILGDRGVAIQFTARLDQFGSVEKTTTSIALIATGIIIETVRADTFHVTIGQEALTLFAEELGHCILHHVSVFVDLLENILSDLSLFFRGGATKVIKGEVEPFVDAGVDRMVLVAKSLAGDTFFQSLGFSGRAVFVRAADIKSVVATHPAVTSIHISTQGRADNVAQMRNVVDVGKG